MRIAVLSSSYPTSVETAASSFLQDWVTALGSRGHQVTVIAPCDRHDAEHVEYSGRTMVSYFQYAASSHLQTLAYGAGMYDNVLRNPCRLLQLPRFLRMQHRHALRHAADADLLHAHWLFPGGLVGAIVKRQTGIPLVISIHSTDFHLLRSVPGGRALARAVVARTDRLHFVTEYHRVRFLEWLGEGWTDRIASYVVPMGVHDSMAVVQPPALRAEPRIGFMGRLIPIKGVDRLLEACAHLGRTRLHVAGAGPSQASLVRLARALGVEAQFLGSVRGAAKIRFLDSCDVLVFPSRHYSSGRSEGLPVSILEAMARGRVVVASDSGGIPEVVRHGDNGYLFAAQSTSELRHVLGTVLRSWDSATRVGTSAIRTGIRFTASALARCHEREYRALLSGVERQVASV
jgi:glycosyltransferase involved in cell wall biosynthesis